MALLEIHLRQAPRLEAIDNTPAVSRNGWQFVAESEAVVADGQVGAPRDLDDRLVRSTGGPQGVVEEVLEEDAEQHRVFLEKGARRALPPPPGRAPQQAENSR